MKVSEALNFILNEILTLSVYDGDIDNIVGILHIKRMQSGIITKQGNPDVPVIEVARKTGVYSSMHQKIEVLLKMQKEKRHMVIAGMNMGELPAVAMEDIL